MQDFSQLSSKTVTEVLMLEMKMAPAAKAYLVSGYPRSMRDVVEYQEKVNIRLLFGPPFRPYGHPFTTSLLIHAHTRINNHVVSSQLNPNISLFCLLFPSDTSCEWRDFDFMATSCPAETDRLWRQTRTCGFVAGQNGVG